MNNSFSRIALVGKVEDSRVADSLALLAAHLLARGLAVSVDRDAAVAGLPEALERRPVRELGRDADLIVAVGGDGTMLFAAQLALARGIPLLGVNRGRLGFLTDVLPDDKDVWDGDYYWRVACLQRLRCSATGPAPAVSDAIAGDRGAGGGRGGLSPL